MTGTLSAQDYRYAFRLPERGRTAVLLAPQHIGTVARIKRMNSGYMVVTVEVAKGAFTGRSFGPHVGEIGTLFQGIHDGTWKADVVPSGHDYQGGDRIQVGSSANVKALICDLVFFLSNQGADNGIW